MYWTCGQCCVFCMWVLGSNIVIGVYVLDMWCCVPHVGGWVWYGDRTRHTGHIVSVMSFTCDGWI